MTALRSVEKLDQVGLDLLIHLDGHIKLDLMFPIFQRFFQAGSKPLMPLLATSSSRRLALNSIGQAGIPGTVVGYSSGHFLLDRVRLNQVAFLTSATSLINTQYRQLPPRAGIIDTPLTKIVRVCGCQVRKCIHDLPEGRPINLGFFPYSTIFLHLARKKVG